jgi:hypothetical protein
MGREGNGGGDWRVEGDGYDDRMYEMCSLRGMRNLADGPKGLKPEKVGMMMTKKKKEEREGEGK